MAKTLTPVDASFFDTARVKPQFKVRINQPIERVFAAIAEDPAGWSNWFPGFGPGGHYVEAEGKLGATRVVTANGQTMSETVIAWEAPTRWAFTLVKARMPGVTSLAEDYRLSADGDATVLTWTMALALSPLGAPMSIVIRLVGGQLIKRAGRNLERYIAAA